MEQEPKEYDLCGRVIGAAMKVHSALGPGFLELKSIQALAKAYEVQLVNYLVATAIDEGLLLNFGSQSLEKRRFVLT